MASDFIKELDLVRVRENITEQSAVSILPFCGKTFNVSRVKSLKGGTYMELSGACSEKGVPFAFTEDWLEKL